MHLALLGDSIFDNAAYTGGQPDVIARLRHVLPTDSRATLLAVDGAVASDVHDQLANIPADATHLILSAGGNDALGVADVLLRPASSVAEALWMLSEVAQSFASRYESLLDVLTARDLPLAVCTIYDPRFSDPMQQRVCVSALSHFNDAIVRAARQRGLPVLDLRAVCTKHDDYANDIEPSSQGAAKIAREIFTLAQTHDFSARRTTVYPAPSA